MLRNLALALLALPLVAGCSSSGSSGPTKVRSAAAKPVSTPRAVIRTPVRRPPALAPVQAIPGLEGVIGATPAELTRQFGTARLDVWEGDARKLQFAGTPCVLDVYLYPGSAGKEPQASYIEARRGDGREVDRLACVTALRKP